MKLSSFLKQAKTTLLTIRLTKNTIYVNRHNSVGDVVGVDEGLVVFIIEWMVALTAEVLSVD